MPPHLGFCLQVTPVIVPQDGLEPPTYSLGVWFSCFHTVYMVVSSVIISTYGGIFLQLFHFFYRFYLGGSTLAVHNKNILGIQNSPEPIRFHKICYLVKDE